MSLSSLHAAVQIRLLRAYWPTTPNGPYISYILFADDCVLVTRATIRDAPCLKLILDAYCYYSGQAVNLEKSFLLFSPAASNSVKEAISGVTANPLVIWSSGMNTCKRNPH